MWVEALTAYDGPTHYLRPGDVADIPYRIVQPEIKRGELVPLPVLILTCGCRVVWKTTGFEGAALLGRVISCTERCAEHPVKQHEAEDVIKYGPTKIQFGKVALEIEAIHDAGNDSQRAEEKTD